MNLGWVDCPELRLRRLVIPRGLDICANCIPICVALVENNAVNLTGNRAKVNRGDLIISSGCL